MRLASGSGGITGSLEASGISGVFAGVPEAAGFADAVGLAGVAGVGVTAGN